MTLKAIFALDQNNLIGAKNYIGYYQPFYLRKDIQNFQNLTKGNCVVMGKNTFRALHEKPLPNRLNIVISKSLESSDVIVLKSIKDAVTLSNWLKKDIYIIGGANLIQQLMNQKVVEECIITRIHSAYKVKNGIYYDPDLTNFKLISNEPYLNQLDVYTNKKVNFTIEHWRK